MSGKRRREDSRGLTRGRVVIGYAMPGEVDCFFHESICHVITRDYEGMRRIRGRRIAVRSGPTIHLARNDIVRQFLAHPDSPEWLLMCDADMVFGYEHVRLLLANADAQDVPVLGGLCFSANSHEVWPVMLVFREGGTIARVRKYPKNAMCKVDATGAAFLLIHRRVLEAIGERYTDWFDFTKRKDDGAPFSEDVTFCVRAASCGFPIWVHTGIRIGHMKAKPVGEADYERYLAECADEGEERVAGRAREAIVPA